MDTFRVWKEKEEKRFGEYRTKRVILEIYDEMTQAIESGQAYHTRLEPGAADPAVAHEPRLLDRGWWRIRECMGKRGNSEVCVVRSGRKLFLLLC
jgi:hypothetical protein